MFSLLFRFICVVDRLMYGGYTVVIYCMQLRLVISKIGTFVQRVLQCLNRRSVFMSVIVTFSGYL